MSLTALQILDKAIEAGGTNLSKTALGVGRAPADGALLEDLRGSEHLSKSAGDTPICGQSIWPVQAEGAAANRRPQ